jgi:hypothetical protein
MAHPSPANGLNTPLPTSAIGGRLAGAELMNVFRFPGLALSGTDSFAPAQKEQKE